MSSHDGVDMGCGSHFGGKARLVGSCEGLGLVGALYLAWGSAGKRGWLVWTGLHGTPVRFPSWANVLKETASSTVDEAVSAT